MLLFIKYVTTHTGILKSIKIHLMLLFIDCLTQITNGTEKNSNTSHVIIYRRRKKQRTADNHIQIHLMLLFINALLCLCCTFLTFKYISCYYLSNGSLISFGFVNIFKYISCYYLSIAGLPEEWREG